MDKMERERRDSRALLIAGLVALVAGVVMNAAVPVIAGIGLAIWGGVSLARVGRLSSPRRD